MKAYTEGSEITYIFIDELPIEEQQPFILFLFGCTCPLIGDGKRKTAYITDYKTFKRWQQHLGQ